MRSALSLRQAQAEYAIDRGRLADAIRAGELRASRLGQRRYLVLRSDLEAYIRSHQVPADTGAAAWARDALAREQGRTPRD